MSISKHSAERVAGREHIPLYPNGFIAIRIVQLVLALMVIGLAAFGLSVSAFDGDIFIMVVGIFTLIVTIYHLVAWYSAPHAYNYWAVLALDIFLIVMWLASFALLASEVADFFSIASYYGGISYFDMESEAWLDCMAAASGLGGAEFVLFVVSLVIHSIRLHRHRSVGLHCTPGVPRTIPTTDAEAKPAAPQQQAYPVAAQQATNGHYSQQPQQQQVYAQQPQTQAYAPVQAAAYHHQTVDPLAAHQTGGSYVQQPQQQQPVVYQQTQ